MGNSSSTEGTEARAREPPARARQAHSRANPVQDFQLSPKRVERAHGSAQRLFKRLLEAGDRSSYVMELVLGGSVRRDTVVKGGGIDFDVLFVVTDRDTTGARQLANGDFTLPGSLSPSGRGDGILDADYMLKDWLLRKVRGLGYDADRTPPSVTVKLDKTTTPSGTYYKTTFDVLPAFEHPHIRGAYFIPADERRDDGHGRRWSLAFPGYELDTYRALGRTLPQLREVLVVLKFYNKERRLGRWASAAFLHAVGGRRLWLKERWSTSIRHNVGVVLRLIGEEYGGRVPHLFRRRVFILDVGRDAANEFRRSVNESLDSSQLPAVRHHLAQSSLNCR